ncbi:type VI secretion system-associated protein TagF [Desulfosarcina ovata]|uniref:Type VI secretion-associated protein n=2 Tax=Desulfosarcina ovata TaxID=83564 RepID=A0A5K8A8L7_9BACT|nr:type VI secretion system-associated protein TagF [Desulfosarcina ovata]BBO81519.1 hypothetical protein DSCO28_20850 [Desulfosarcina ovata subsp. sediminis]BBO88778.1 hypothetical protein DSCOOX_19580 [Desulfosarcina ovata subsp. ovata]
MLGRIIGWRQWSWSAFGKHPSARDYFQIQMTSPLAKAFGEWVGTGFGRLSEEIRRNGVYSWRFWSRGVKKGMLICGLAKSSADAIGRPYPLILLGEGPLNRWEQNWQLLPFVLSPMWEKMEYMASRRIAGIGELEADLERMDTPIAAWQKILTEKAEDGHGQDKEPVNKIIMDNLQEKAGMLEAQLKLAVSLDQGGQTDPLVMSGAWHQALKSHLKGTPNTVFMGGSLERAFAVFFSRPLMVDDFTDLWSR